MASAFQNNAFQNDAFQQTSSTAASVGAGGRRIAYDPLLAIAILGNETMRFRGRSRLRPDYLSERQRKVRVTSKTARAKISSASLGSQLSFTGGSYYGLPETEPGLPPSDNQPD